MNKQQNPKPYPKFELLLTVVDCNKGCRQGYSICYGVYFNNHHMFDVNAIKQTLRTYEVCW